MTERADSADYTARSQRLLQQYAAIPPGQPVRLAKRTSNLFRSREAASAPGLDVRSFDGVLAVDPEALTADVQGMTTYEHLLDVTLAHGLAPLVVPQLKTITIGGAVTGLGIESTSFRSGLPHESVREMEVLTGDGRLVTARRDNEHAALLRGFPNSYGTLGYALRLTIGLERVHPFVRLRHLQFDDPAAMFKALDAITDARSHDGQAVDFLDGVIFAADECYLTLGSWADSAPYVSDYTGREIYYRSLQERHEDYLTVRDYYWRWDTDWFWCSRAFGAQNPRIRRLWPKRKLRSDVYARLIALETRYGVASRINRWKGKPPVEKVVQDIEVPVERAAEFAAWFLREVPITPVWTCPLRLREDSPTWDLYPMAQGTTYVNFGFWSTVPLANGEPDGTFNRRVEAEVDRLDGRKSLYSTSYYERDHFGRLYGGDAYADLKRTYDASGRLLDLYDKAVRAR